MKANRPKMDALKQDIDFYQSINQGQWTPTAVQRMEQQKRPIVTWNFIMKHIDTEAGMLLQNPYEFSFDTEYGQNPKNAQLMNELRLRDKDLGKWTLQKILFVIDFLINTGVLEPYIDKSKDKLGAVNYRRRRVRNFEFDQHWESNNIEDNKQIFSWSYMYPDDIERTFGNTMDKRLEIREAIKRFRETRGQELQTFEAEKWSRTFIPLVRKDQYLVVQMMEMKHKNESVLYSPDTGEFHEGMTNLMQKDAFMRLNAMQGLRLIEIPNHHSKECQLKVFAPGLSQEVMLADGPHPLQIGGYPLIVASPKNIDGQRFGRVEQYKDPQSVYNKELATLLHWKMTTSLGSTFIDPGAFNDATEEKRYIDEGHTPGGFYRTQDSSKIRREERERMPTDLMATADHAMNFMDRIGTPMAARAETQHAGESGVLFNARREQAAVADEPLSKILENAENQAGEMYLKIATQHYADGVPRTFQSKEDGSDVYVNMDAQTDISRIGRLSVRITQSPVGESLKRENLAVVATLRKATKDPLEDALLAQQTVKLIPGLEEETRNMMEETLQLSVDAAKAEKQVVIAQAAAAGVQPQQPQKSLGSGQQAETNFPGMPVSLGDVPAE
jgi:hypothetical protein